MDQVVELGNQIVRSNLSFEDFIKTIELINLKLRGKEQADETTGIYKGDMIVDGLVSPSNKMQMVILKKLYDTLQEDIDPQAKAMTCYYTINNLHLFQDGNGRTSRFFYQLYSNNLNEEYLYHPNSAEDTSKRYKFEKDNNLSSPEQFLNIINYNLYSNMLSDGIIHDTKRMREYSRVSTYTVDLFSDEHFKTTFLSDEVVKELGDEAKEVARNISNRNCNFSISGLAMCELLTRNNTIEKYIELNDEHFKRVSEKNNIDATGNLLFYVGSNDEYGSDVHAEEWDAKTCKEYVAISEKLLLDQYEMIVEASKYYANKKQEGATLNNQ